MGESVIEVVVDEETARSYRAASSAEKARYAARLASVVRHGANREEANRRLTDLMDEVGQQAEGQGLTDEVLADLLTDSDADRP